MRAAFPLSILLALLLPTGCAMKRDDTAETDVDLDCEVCDGADNDGDGEVDEGLDCSYDVTLDASADDAMTAYFDGALAGAGASWDGGDKPPPQRPPLAPAGSPAGARGFARVRC